MWSKGVINLVGKVGSIPKDINAKKGHYKARYLQIAKKQSKLRTKSIIVANLDGGELMLLLNTSLFSNKDVFRFTEFVLPLVSCLTDWVLLKLVLKFVQLSIISRIQNTEQFDTKKVSKREGEKFKTIEACCMESICL